MKLYRPVLIESAEQAEALPDGTVIVDGYGGWRNDHDEFEDTGKVIFRDPDGIEMDPEWMVRAEVTALVPTEAGEEWEDEGRPVWTLGEGEVTSADVDDYERRNGRRPSRRLVTPWGEA